MFCNRRCGRHRHDGRGVPGGRDQVRPTGDRRSLAEPLVRAVGMDFFPVGQRGLDAVAADAVLHLMTDVRLTHTVFDDLFADAGRADIRQTVIVASWLDARLYRLSWLAAQRASDLPLPNEIAPA